MKPTKDEIDAILQPFETPKTVTLAVKIKDVRLFGKLEKIAKHTIPTDARDITDAIDDALRNGFESLYIYSSVADPSVFLPWFQVNYSVTSDCDGTIFIYIDEV